MRHLPLTTLALAATQLALAQNPLITGQFTADPTARVFGDRLYVYPSHDIPPSTAPGVRQDWFCMADYHVYSTDNLVDWTDHGVILDQKQVPWGNPDAYSMWAPDCIQGKDGRYYFYFPDAPKEGKGFGVGVAISNRPMGPFRAEEQLIEGIHGIDPCVLQASDGGNYIFWGGGGLWMARLSDDLLSLEGEPQEVTGLPEGFKEGPFAFEHEGKYYLTYPWVRYKKGEKNAFGEVDDNPTECLAYAMADAPMGPYRYGGVIMKESPTHCWTNHHSIVEFRGQWYLFYHHNDYSPTFDKNRSIRCDSLTFNADGSIQEVKATLRGVGVTDGRGLVQMDRGTLRGGATIGYLNEKVPFEGWKLTLPQSASAEYGNVRMPEGDYETWVRIVDNEGEAMTLPIGKTQLKLKVSPLENGLASLTLTNQGKLPVDVDWICLNARMPQLSLPNPLAWANGKGEVKNLQEWSLRREELSQLIQQHEIGTIPEVKREQVEARMAGDTLLVTVHVGDSCLTLWSVIQYPEVGEAPYALMIGSSHNSLPNELFVGRPIARMDYHERQVNGYSQFRGDPERSHYGFVHLYPELIDNGAYAEWAWGFQRLMDGLEILGPEVTRIDVKHIGVTGCSYAGKMALFCGAFDPRVALTIAQEPGGGGAAAWRVSHTLSGVEDLDRTDFHWFKESLREQFHGDLVYTLPDDHHELCALICPRAFLMLGNTDYRWLADESGYVSVNAARRVWERLGVGDRMGYSILGGHPHCQLPKEQYPEVEAFIDRFLLGKEGVDTNDISIAPDFKGKVKLEGWIGE